ncbi:putative gustatory receptor 28b [Lycorma delicatula]|uniref:putative gustatory receptor 28b n=1 Tax=Lycorma delicatula TaxID=130591 RepID=UPI003F51888B
MALLILISYYGPDFKSAHDSNYFGLYTKWRLTNYSHQIIKVKSNNTDLKTNNNYINPNNIKIAREIHRFLVELSKQVNSYFSVQIIFCTISKIISITFVLFYLLSSSKLEELTLDRLYYWIPHLNKALLCLTNFLQLVLITFVCVSTAEEASFTGVLVHGLLNSDEHTGLKHDLEIFSQQILHQRITFTAAGFFVLDFTLINAVIGAVTTYLVILIQFQLST